MFHNHSLIYQDFKNLESILEEPSGFARIAYKTLINELNRVTQNQKKKEQYITAIFNEAYWISLRVLNFNFPELYFNEYFPKNISDDGSLYESQELTIIKALVYGIVSIYDFDRTLKANFTDKFYISNKWDEQDLPNNLIDFAVRNTKSINLFQLPLGYNMECFDSALAIIQKAYNISSIFQWLESILCDFDLQYFKEITQHLDPDRKQSFVSALSALLLNRKLPQDISAKLHLSHQDFIDQLTEESSETSSHDFFGTPNLDNPIHTSSPNHISLTGIPHIYKDVFQNNKPLYDAFESFILESIYPRVHQHAKKDQSRTTKWKWWHVRHAFIQTGLIDPNTHAADFNRAIHKVLHDCYKTHNNIGSSRGDETKLRSLTQIEINIINEIKSTIQIWLNSHQKPVVEEPSTPPHYPGDLPF